MSLDHALILLEQYGYFILFPLAIVEGPIITVIAGLLVSMGIFNPFLAYGTVVLGDIVGDSFWYAVGRFGHGGITASIERFFGITQQKIEAVKGRLEKNRFKMTALSKLIQGIGVVGLVAAGVVRVSYPLFVFACLLVTLLQVAVYLGIGIFFGRAYEQIGSYVDYFARGTFILGGCALVFLVWYFWRKRSAAK